MVASLDENYEKEKRENVQRQILEQNKPNIWNVHESGNMERALEVDFQKFGLQVSERMSLRLEEINTFTFYAAVEHLKENKQ